MRFLAVLFGLALVLPAHAYNVIGISDGDNTLTLLVDEKPQKVRLANIDEPKDITR